MATAILQAQSKTTIYTPKGTAVTANIYSELSQEEKEMINDEVENSYPRAQRLTDPTTSYNCHAYAWYLSDDPSSAKYWLNTPNDDIYWQDGSFIEVCNESEAQKVSYAIGDHSAIRSLSVAGKYDSKWGAWPLMRHNPTYSPYDSDVLKYYVSTKISSAYTGTSVSCNTPFSVASITGGTYSWTSSPNITLNTTSGSSVLASANGSGMGWLEVSITSPCSGTTVMTRLVVPVENRPSGRVNYNTSVKTLQGTNFVAWSYIQVYLDHAYNFTFNATSRTTGAPISLSSSSNSTAFTMPNSERNGVDVTITSTNSPCQLSGTFFFIPTGPPPGSYFVSSPNPASADLTVAEVSDEPAITTAPLASPFEAELYDFYGKKVKNQKSEKGKVILNVLDLPNGLYNLRVGKGEKPFTQLIQITH